MILPLVERVLTVVFFWIRDVQFGRGLLNVAGVNYFAFAFYTLFRAVRVVIYVSNVVQQRVCLQSCFSFS